MLYIIENGQLVISDSLKCTEPRFEMTSCPYKSETSKIHVGLVNYGTSQYGLEKIWI